MSGSRPLEVERYGLPDPASQPAPWTIAWMTTAWCCAVLVVLALVLVPVLGAAAPDSYLDLEVAVGTVFALVCVVTLGPVTGLLLARRTRASSSHVQVVAFAMLGGLVGGLLWVVPLVVGGGPFGIADLAGPTLWIAAEGALGVGVGRRLAGWTSNRRLRS